MTILLTADHGSDHVPDDVELGIDPALLSSHIAVDIGVAPLGRRLAGLLGADLHMAEASRLVVDPNRAPDDPAVIPVSSDGHAVPGNAVLCAAGRAARLERYWTPYHERLAVRIAAARPGLIVALHSFTPRLAARPDEARPWHVGLLYNRDDRAARIAMRLFAETGLMVGDNQPYPGDRFNHAMDRHAEAVGIPYLTLEVRQDLIACPAGASEWAERIAPVIRATRAALPEAGR